jgi:hypothetical protein
LIRYKIPYKSVNPYFTFAIVDVDFDKKKMTRLLSMELDSIRKKYIFKPKTISVERGIKNDFIVIEFHRNDEFMSQVFEIFRKANVTKYRETNFSRIMSVDCNSFSGLLLNDMLNYMPNFVNVKMGNAGMLIKNKWR